MKRFNSVEDYVKALGGTRAIKKILIANNGLSALKCLRSLKEWSYEAFGKQLLKFVVMATPDDLKANAEFIHHGDEFIQVLGGSPQNNYANVKLVVDIALQTKCDAVWPGWGFSSENPELPKQLSAKGIKFIGPDAKSMYMLGDKISSTILAKKAGVPVIPWSGSDVEVESTNITKEEYESACIHSEKEALEAAKKIGFPIMVKASEGGGGKGIRKCTNKEELIEGYNQVRKEVAGSPIFLMKLSGNNRHLEVQIIADEYGNAIALHSRDCSVQRRHQKIIEEGPITVASPEVIEEMEQAAVELTKLVNYKNAGTVEYLFDNGKFYFLELNPRLQVEHPVSEWITNVNLPAMQLQVAMGIPLSNIPDTRRFYGKKDLYSIEDKIDFKKEKPLPAMGHVIAARITAESPENGFLGTSGSINELTFSNSRSVWGYFSVRVPGAIHTYSDSQFGHIFAHGNTREEARSNMIVALSRLVVRGKISNTSEYIMNLLEMDTFKNNKHTTSWLDQLISEKEKFDKPNKFLVIISGAVFRLSQFMEENKDVFEKSIRRGQYPEDSCFETKTDIELIYENIKYKLKGYCSSPSKFVLEMNDSFKEVEMKKLSDGGFLLVVDGESHVCYGEESSQGTRITLDGKVCYFSEERDPTKLKASVSGKIVKYKVEDGEIVKPGTAVMEIEVMKMILAVKVELGGKIKFHANEGAVINQGDLLASLELDLSKLSKNQKFKSAELCTEKFNSSNSPNFVEYQRKKDEIKPHQIVKESIETLKNFLIGYNAPNKLIESKISEALSGLDLLLDGNTVLIYQFIEEFSKTRANLPDDLRLKFDNTLSSKFYGLPKIKRDPTIMDILYTTYKETIEKIKKLGIGRLNEFENNTIALNEIFKKHKSGMDYYRYSELTPLLELYLNIERFYDTSKPKDQIMSSLRSKFFKDEGSNEGDDGIMKIFEIFLSHKQLKRNNNLIINLIEKYAKFGLVKRNDVIIGSIASFTHKDYKAIVNAAQKLLVNSRLPSYQKTYNEISSIFEQIISLSKEEKNKIKQEERKNLIKKIVNNSEYGFDVLLSFFNEKKHELRNATTEAYIEKAYNRFKIDFLQTGKKEGGEKKEDQIEVSTFIFTDDSRETDLNDLAKSSNDVISGGVTPKPESDSKEEIEFPKDEEKKEKEKEVTPKPKKKELPKGFGVFGFYKQMNDIYDDKKLSILINEFNRTGKEQIPNERNVVSLLVLTDNKPPSTEIVPRFEQLLARNISNLQKYEIRRLTLVIKLPKMSPYFYTFRQKLNFKEDPIYRNVEPTLAYYLELQKLANYDVTAYQLKSGTVHAFFGKPKSKFSKKLPMGGRYMFLNTRFFIRTTVYQGDLFSDLESLDFKLAEAEKYFVKSLDGLEHALSATEFSEDTFSNHIFINYIPIVNADDNSVKYLISKMQTKYAKRLLTLRVEEVEMKLRLRSGDNSFIPIRVIISNRTHVKTEVDIYMETRSSSELGNKLIYSSLWGVNKDMEGKEISTPYPVMKKIDVKRNLAHIYNTSYVYDFPFVFRRALKLFWYEYCELNNIEKTSTIIPNEEELIEIHELVLSDKKDKNGNEILKELSHEESLERIEKGENKIAMIAWKLILFTPQFPKSKGGQEIIVISNDITVLSGSFGPKEDLLFDLASKYSRKFGIPRIYITANSGARIGLAEEIKSKFKICWKDEKNQKKGFEYIYISENDFKEIGKYVITEKLTTEKQEIRYKIKGIIGKQNGIGVECLSGSGLIAGETSRAYKDVFTISFVSSRSVGIGAYLVRLGQRIIQNTKPPILLTGANALNKLLGKKVYVSHNQLGGTQIMYPNGVSHLVSQNDLDGISKIIKWLSYVPKSTKFGKNNIIPILKTSDPIDREVEATPSANKEENDPRDWIRGRKISDGKGGFIFEKGLFDKGSFFETLSGWAKSVVVGRARLGGIPIGVIAVETKTTEEIIPADPADFKSKEKKVSKAGQVWFPDSAYKTAQAIWDFNNGEQLPLMIFANWRGFSGGQRDMFKEILKYGSYIVDALVEYKQPIFIYIPPYGELRGGAWVVVDPKINSDYIEMYCDSTAKGGVLEPSGTIEIKYRKKDIIKTIQKEDPTYISLKKELENPNLKENEISIIKEKMEKRINDVYNIYHSIAIHFADLHDTPGRMKNKNVINDIIDWKNSRKFFYWRLRRLLIEFKFYKQIQQFNTELNKNDKKTILKQLINNDQIWLDNEKCTQWYLSNMEKLENKIKELKNDQQIMQINNLLSQDNELVIQQFLKYISKKENQGLKKTVLSNLIMNKKF